MAEERTAGNKDIGPGSGSAGDGVGGDPAVDLDVDEVGPAVIPTVEEIRRKFSKRRQGQGGLDRLLRRLLGLEAKMRQYRDGARFCRAVIDEVGMTGFNQVWSSPATLPSREEIADPALWLARMPSAA